MDNRAQSVGIARFLLSMVVAAILAWIVTTITSPILEGTPDGNRQAAEATAWLTTGTETLFIGFVIIGVFGLVALSVYQRELLG